jgi:hypothetical protein
MATPINAPMAGEIWHLSIEDLFQPVQEAPRLGGDGPFVINLSVSTAPISVPTKAFTNSPLAAHVYQIQVTEDGRTRYRLRLGPFTSEDQADAILAEVRDTYPGALTATASASDLRVIATMQAKAEHRPAAAPKAAAVPKTTDIVEKFLSQKIPAAKPATEVAAKAAPPKAAVAERDAAAKPEVPEISIDIAWPTPELGVPPGIPTRAVVVAAAPPVPTVVAAVVATVAAPSVATVAKPPVPKVVAPPALNAVPAPVSMASAPQPQWSLPELDVPLPTVQKHAAAPVASSPTVAPKSAPAAAAKPFELQIAPPFSIASIAPVLTEVVTVAKTPARRHAAPKPAVIAAPVLTEVVAPKTKAPAQPAPSAPAPAATATAAAPVKSSPKPETAPPTKKAVAPAQKQTPAPPPKPAIPKSAAPLEAAKQAPVLTQSVVPARKGWPKFRASLGKPLPSKLTSLQHVVVATAPAPAAREVKKLDEPLESLESTQTIRALTPKELEDNEVSRWFVIQLALADHAFDPDAVPNLDIFSEYRLYSVAGLDQGRVVHALRLGFFREEIGAVAVAAYLAAYWDKPTIKRVSLAERERFADQRVEARKDVGATGKHAVIEITDELVARRRRSAKAAASKTPNLPLEH